MWIIKKDISVLGEDSNQGLEGTRITAEAKYPVNFRRPGRRFVLSLHYNGSNSFLFVNTVKLYQVKVKDSEPFPLCLGNILKDFTIDSLKKKKEKKTLLKGYVLVFSVDYIIITLLILTIFWMFINV